MHQSRGLPHAHLLWDVIVISDDASSSHSSDSDGPISKRARTWAVKNAANQMQLQTPTLAGHAETIDIAMPSMPPSEQPALNLSQILPNVKPQRRSIRIHDSDDEITAPHIASVKVTYTTSTPVVQADLRDGPPLAESMSAMPPPVEDDDTNAPLFDDGRRAFHSFFARFAGCQHGVLETDPEPAEGADILDLRRAVPETFQLRFQQIESAHVPAHSDDSSGHTNSDSDSSMSDNFVDDEVVMTPSETEYLAQYIAKVLPVTATSLKSPPPLIHKSPRKRVISSSSSSSPLPAS
jgi:hypothetical protein